MHQFCRVAAFFLLLFLSINVAAQSYPNTLLWRISGNGLARPSYLYGTIHLTDKRVFNFGDSVYQAIKSADGFALEVNPELFMLAVINQIDKMDPRKIKDILNSTDTLKYRKALSQKLRKPFDEITTHDILKENNKWLQNLQSDGMETFMDGYLYGIAKGQAKWIGGVEDVDDQLGIIGDLVDRSMVSDVALDGQPAFTKVVNKMVEVYLKQDLQGINAMMNEMDTAQTELLLTKRNQKMARRIDSLAGARSMFFAIGAAHLPGTEGVLSLLQERGFTLTPVFSKNRIPAGKYTYKKVPQQWSVINEPLYTAAMPGVPGVVKILGLFDTKFYMDISKMTGYQTYAVMNTLMNVNNFHKLDSLMHMMYPAFEPKLLKKWDSAGITGATYLLDKNEDLKFKITVQEVNNRIYVASMFARNKEQLESDDAVRFFSAYGIKKDAEKDAPVFYDFKDSVMGVQITGPAPFQYNEKFSDPNSNGWKVTTYTSSDMIRGIFVFLFSKELQRGRYIVSDSLVNADFKVRLGKLYRNFHEQPFTAGTVTGWRATNLKNDQYPLVRSEMISFIRENKNILVQITADSATLTGPLVTKMIQSIYLFPVQESGSWAENIAPDGSFSAWTPSAITKTDTAVTEAFSRTEMTAYDTLSATSYIIIADKPGKYYWAATDTSFFTQQKQYWNNEGGSLLYEKTVTVGGISCRERLVTVTGSNVYRRQLFIPSVNGVYVLSAWSKKDRLFTPNVNRFFSDFKWISNPIPFDFKSSKAALLLEDLRAPDSLVRAAARANLSEAPFTQQDVPLLNEALFRTYPLRDAHDDSLAINRQISKHLQHLGTAESVDYIADMYSRLTQDQAALKNLVLTTLSGIHTQKSYDTLAAILLKYPLQDAPEFAFRNNLQDSLALTKTIFTSLAPLAADANCAPFMAHITIVLLDSGYIQANTVSPMLEAFAKDATALIPVLKTDAEYDYQVDALFELLGRFKGREVLPLLSAFQYSRDNWLKETALMILVKNGLPVADTIVTALSEDPVHRYDLFTRLKEIGKESVMPLKYRSQRLMAASQLMNSDDDEVPYRLSFIKEKTAVVSGKTYKFYLFKADFGEGDEKTSYLGIAGGYAAEPGALEPVVEMTGYFLDDVLDEKKIEEQFLQYIRLFDETE